MCVCVYLNLFLKNVFMFCCYCCCCSILFSIMNFCVEGARCNSVVRPFAHGAMGHQIDPSWWTHLAISRSSQCSTTGVTKAEVCDILSVG